jgi:hypothetical protein
MAIICLVTSDMPGDLLIGWKELMRIEILMANFPKGPGSLEPTEKEEQDDYFAVRKAKVERKDKNEEGKKFNKLKSEDLLGDYSDVFSDTREYWSFKCVLFKYL